MKNATIRYVSAILGLGMAGAFSVATALAEDVVYLKNKSTIAAKSIIWRESAQEYRVETPEGTMIPVAKGQVERLDIDKPAGFDKAVQAVDAKQYDAAVPALEDIISKYKMLVWDVKAKAALARVYLAKGDGKKALALIETVFENTPKAEAPAEVRRLYWNALMAAQKGATLKTELGDAIAKGGTDVAAEAQVMRGDMNRAEGKKEDALLDYLRAVILYSEVKGIQPEALFKAAQMLDELRDPRGDELRKRVLNDYPGSEYARKLGGK